MDTTNIKNPWRERRLTFKALHQGGGAFVIPNPWDIGTAKFLAAMGFKALATTSAGYAFAQGKPDNHINRSAMFAHIKDVVSASALPVSADLENGYGDDPACVGETIKMALDHGLAGASIEDARGKPHSTVYPLALAVERVQAAVEAAQSKQTNFMLTARAENYLCGNPDLKDTITRLQAYQDAGADVLYAPGLSNIDDIRTLVSAVDKPVNVVMGLARCQLTVEDLAAVNVKRISVGSAFSRLAFGALKQASIDILTGGNFSFSERAIPFAEIDGIMQN